MSEVRDGDFVLTLSSPQSTWTTTDPIAVVATLNYVGEKSATAIYGACGPALFNLIQMTGGSAVLAGAQCQPCLTYDLGPNSPLVLPYAKSGVVAPPFDQSFFDDPQLHLSAGRWQFGVVLDYGIDGCGEGRVLQTTIEIEVVATTASDPTKGSPAPTIETPTPAPRISPPPTREACMTALGSGALGADPEGRPTLMLEGQAPVSIVFSHPEDYRIEAEPILRIYSVRGDLLATEGDFVELGGGFNADDTIFFACSFKAPDTLDP